MDSSINSDTGNSDSGGAQEICASLDSFSVNGTPPAVGDKVEFKTEGTVSRVEGGNAYVTPETVNGSPVMQDQGSPDEGNMDENALRQNAQGLDNQQYATGGVVRGAVAPGNVTPRMKKTVKNLNYNPYGSGIEDRHGG